METGSIVWLVVYIVLIVTIIITYGIAFGIHEYPEKENDWKRAVLGIVATVSLMSLAGSGIAVGVGSPLAAAGLIFLSLLCDFGTGAIVGPRAYDSETGALEIEPGLVTAIYLPIVAKTAMLWYFAYAGGAYMESRAGPNKSAIGTGQFRRQGESFTDYRSRRGYPSRS